MIRTSEEKERIQSTLEKIFTKDKLTAKLAKFCEDEIYPFFEDIKKPQKREYENLAYEWHKGVLWEKDIVIINDPHDVFTQQDIDLVLNDERGKWASLKKNAIIVTFEYKIKKTGVQWHVEVKPADIETTKLY